MLTPITHIETRLQSGNLVEAREKLAHIVGRDTSAFERRQSFARQLGIFG